jgi:hypothetical protein
MSDHKYDPLVYDELLNELSNVGWNRRERKLEEINKKESRNA